MTIRPMLARLARELPLGDYLYEPSGAVPLPRPPRGDEGRRLELTNLDKVLWPETGTTKAEHLEPWWTPDAPTPAGPVIAAYRRGAEEAGREPGEIVLQTLASWAETDEAALDGARRPQRRGSLRLDLRGTGDRLGRSGHAREEDPHAGAPRRHRRLRDERVRRRSARDGPRLTAPTSCRRSGTAEPA